MAKFPFNNDSTPRERRATIRNEQRVRASTYVDHVHDDLSGGRFAKEFPTEKVGAAPVPQYPRQPSSPWTGDQATEPPLGFSVDEPPIVGEAFEVEKSLREASNEPPADPGASRGGEERSVQGGDPTGRPRRHLRKKG